MALDGLLKNKLAKYKNAELCQQDCVKALHRYNNLSPDLQKFMHNDGRESELLSLDGTLPVSIRGATYNIPVCVWLQENHPYVPPLVYVKPTSSMAIKASQYVDTNGRVYHPFLHDWDYPKSDLAALLQILCCVFAEHPPVYSKPAQPQQAAAHRPPPAGYTSQYGGHPPNQAASKPYPVRGSARMPMPGTSPGGSTGSRPPYPLYPPQGGANRGQSNPPYPVSQLNFPASIQASLPGPPSYPSVTRTNLVTTDASTVSNSNLSDDQVKASLRTAVEDKLRRRTKALFEQAQVGANRGQSNPTTRTDLSDQVIKASLQSFEEDKLRRSKQALVEHAQKEIDQLNRTQLKLEQRKEKLQEFLQKLEKEQGDVDNDVKSKSKTGN